MRGGSTVKYSKDLLAKISILYYKKGLNQKEIADKIGISRPQVSRLLDKAREKGVVEIRIENSISDIPYQENELAEKFSLREAIIVEAEAEEPIEERKIKTGNKGIHFLDRISAGGEYIGVSAGTTVHTFASQADDLEGENYKVVPIIGALNDTGLSFNSNEVSNILASNLGCKSYLLNAPAFVKSGNTAEVIKNEDRIKKIFKLFSNLDIVFLGIGEADEKHPLFKGHLTEEEITKLKGSDVCGSVGPIFYDLKGRQIEESFMEGIIGISREDLLKTPFRVGMAVGGYKKEAILGAIRGDLINVLITDQPMSDWLIDQ